MKSFRLFILFVCIVVTGAAQHDLVARLSAATTLDQIRDFGSRFRVLGEQHEALYESGGTKLFVIWIQPKGSAAPLFLFAYVFRGNKWALLVDHPETVKFAGGAVVVSVADNAVQILGPDGRIAKSYEIK